MITKILSLKRKLKKICDDVKCNYLDKKCIDIINRLFNRNYLDEKCINIIYDLFKHDYLDESQEIPTECYLYLGLYYQIKNVDQMKKYLLLAIENEHVIPKTTTSDRMLSHVIAMRILADYYQYNNKNDIAIKYYKLASEYGDIDSMVKLACYYQIRKDYDNMYKYCLMAFENGNIDAIIDLIKSCYSKADVRTALMLESILIDKNSTASLRKLAEYYRYTHYEWSEKYYQMAIKQNDIKALYELGSLYLLYKKYQKMMDYFLRYLYHLQTLNINPLDRMKEIFENCHVNSQVGLYFLKLHGQITIHHQKIKEIDTLISNLMTNTN